MPPRAFGTWYTVILHTHVIGNGRKVHARRSICEYSGENVPSEQPVLPWTEHEATFARMEDEGGVYCGENVPSEQPGLPGTVASKGSTPGKAYLRVLPAQLDSTEMDCSPKSKVRVRKGASKEWDEVAWRA